MLSVGVNDNPLFKINEPNRLCSKKRKTHSKFIYLRSIFKLAKKATAVTIHSINVNVACCCFLLNLRLRLKSKEEKKRNTRTKENKYVQ